MESKWCNVETRTRDAPSTIKHGKRKHFQIYMNTYGFGNKYQKLKLHMRVLNCGVIDASIADVMG